MLRKELRIKTPEAHRPLVHVSWKPGQDGYDRLYAEKYKANNATKTFKYLRAYPSGPGKVLLVYLSKDLTTEVRKRTVSVVEFVKRFLLEPNRSVLGMRWTAYGFLGRSRFAPVVEAARKLYVNHNGERVRFLDLHIEEIQARALAFREQHKELGL